MSREIDLRDAEAVQNVKTTGPEQTRFSAGLEAPKDFFVQRAIEHVRNISETLGLEPTQPAEFAADHQIQRTTSGAVSVHLYQLYKNIPVFQAAQAVIFAPDGSLQETAGNTVPIAADLAVAPRLNAAEAALAAARFVATPDDDEREAKDQFGQALPQLPLDLKDFKPKVISSFADLAEHPTVLERGPLGDYIKASLIWFPLRTELRLCWEAVIAMPSNQGRFRVLVDADSGRIVYSTQLTQFIAARGNVFRVDGTGQRQMIALPLPLSEYGVPLPPDLPPGFPDDWIAVSDTSGNSVKAVLDSTGATLNGAMQNGSLVFNPADPAGDEQKVLNLFFYACYMHDFFYLLGFRERDGNFQQDDLNRGGIPLDRLEAHAAPGTVYATANMNTPPDGGVPSMNMGIVSDTARHTALDATVVFHEFTHGVTNRLVGGPLNNHALEAQQSKAMGEGWGDFIACTLNNTNVVAAWVVNNPAGIRGFPYDGSFPDDFGKLGSGRYSEPHNAGEIWCATLMEAARRIGKPLAMQLVVDALKLSPANPSFLDMRDAILLSLDHKLSAGQMSQAAHDDALSKVWGAFAKFGMGQKAKANGASYAGNVADFTAPPAPGGGGGTGTGPAAVHVQTSPQQAIPDKDPAGISSSVNVAQAGVITSIQLSVNIQHPFVGDLEVTLFAPDGSAFVLETPSSNSAQNLVKTYTAATAALAGVIGMQAQGTWTLKVADLVRLGVGFFQQWSLDLQVDSGGRSQPAATQASGSATPNLAIPDKDPNGIASVVAVGTSGRIASASVSVDIAHDFAGDLQITLTSPQGSTITLYSPGMDPSKDLVRTFTPADTPSLSLIAGQKANGNWTLRVADMFRLNTGTLRSWRVDLKLS